MSQPVLLVVSTLDGTGPGRVLATLARHVGDEWEPVLVTTHGVETSPLLDELHDAGIAVEHLRMRGMWDARAVGRMTRLVRRYRPAVVHTRTIRADLIGRTAALSGVPVLNNLVNLYPDDSVALHGAAAGRVLTGLVRASRRAARLLVANAEAVAANASEVFGAPPGAVRVVYDGLDLDRFSGAAPANLSGVGVGPIDRVCVSVTRMHPQKGVEDLVAAAALLRDEAGLHMVVVGGGPDRGPLQTAIDRAGLSGRVHLLGERTDVAALLARAELFVLPSRFEGLPSAVIEAMAAGLPVIATEVGGCGELVDAGVTGWLVPPRSPIALADAIREALAADGAAIGAAGRRKAVAVFDAPRMASQYDALYRELVA
ncbi:MAG TPA: glycosyltransferase [Acidimicrobiales bacterium]|nr:glycosyltransferase [Acidimicrobiales bacterium]